MGHKARLEPKSGCKKIKTIGRPTMTPNLPKTAKEARTPARLIWLSLSLDPRIHCYAMLIYRALPHWTMDIWKSTGAKTGTAIGVLESMSGA